MIPVMATGIRVERHGGTTDDYEPVLRAICSSLEVEQD